MIFGSVNILCHYLLDGTYCQIYPCEHRTYIHHFVFSNNFSSAFPLNLPRLVWGSNKQSRIAELPRLWLAEIPSSSSQRRFRGRVNCQQDIIGSGNGLAPNRRQAIIWTNADPSQWRIYAALGGGELASMKMKVNVLHMQYVPDLANLSYTIHVMLYLPYRFC